MCIGNDYGPPDRQPRRSIDRQGHKNSRRRSHRSRREAPAHQQQAIPLQDLSEQAPQGSAQPGPPVVLSLEDLGYIVAPEVQQAGPPGVQLFTVKYPPAYGPAEVACLGVYTTGERWGSLVVDYITMKGNPPMRDRLGTPHASDVLLGFWCFTAGRGLGDLQVVEIISVAEKTLWNIRAQVYSDMRHGLDQTLVVTPASWEPYSMIRETNFGKMANYML